MKIVGSSSDGEVLFGRKWDVEPNEFFDAEKKIQNKDELLAEYEVYRVLLQGRGGIERIKAMVANIPSHIHIDQWICFGLGNFSAQTLWPCDGLVVTELGNKKGKKGEYLRITKTAMDQLVFFVEFVKAMRRQSHPIAAGKVLFQDPSFTPIELKFLTELDFRPTATISKAEAKSRMTKQTFFFAAGGDIELTETCLERSHPGLYIGHDLADAVADKDIKTDIRHTLRAFKDYSKALAWEQVVVQDCPQDVWKSSNELRCLKEARMT